MNRNRLDQIRNDWSRVCGSCDAGLTMECVCPAEDPRAAIGELLDHIDLLTERLQAGPRTLADLS